MSKTLQYQHKAWLKKWKDDGKETVDINCPHCKGCITNPVPPEDMVASKGYWDSWNTCIYCGKLFFLKTWPDKTYLVRVM